MTSCVLGEVCQCGHCGAYHTGQCPRIKAIEYYGNGQIKRVEYHDPNPAPLPSAVPPWWPMPWLPGQDITGGISIANTPGVEVTQTWCGVNS